MNWILARTELNIGALKYKNNFFQGMVLSFDIIIIIRIIKRHFCKWSFFPFWIVLSEDKTDVLNLKSGCQWRNNEIYKVTGVYTFLFAPPRGETRIWAFIGFGGKKIRKKGEGKRGKAIGERGREKGKEKNTENQNLTKNIIRNA